MNEVRRSPLLSMEGVFALIATFFIWVAEVNWELRCIGVFVTTGLVVHAAKRMQIALGRKVLVAAIVIAILLSSTWRPIWTDFHASFPAVTGEAVLSRIIVACALFAASVAGYWFLLRPRREGYRLIPAQLIAFGGSLIAVGLVAAAIGLLWQFQQNRAMGITTDVGSNLLPSGPNIPQIERSPAPPALPPPSSPEPPPAAQSQLEAPLISGYALTSAGSRLLSDEAFKIKDVLPNLTVLLQNNDNSGRGLASAIARAFSIGGIPSSIGFGQLGGPTETGPIILFDDPEKLPEAALKLKAALEKVGMRVRVIKRAVGTFQFFIGPDPNG